MGPRRFISLLLPLLGTPCATGYAAAAPIEVRLTCVDDRATGYATFQSHNQKVVATRHGVFMTHIRSHDEAYTAQQWRLCRSTDGGRTFATVHEDTHATYPPALEADAAGNLFLVRVDLVGGDAFLYRFDAAHAFRHPPAVTRIPGGAAQKYALLLDEPRGQLYYFGRNDTLYTIGFDGHVRRHLQVLRVGPVAEPQYPQLSLGATGELHLAWTTVKAAGAGRWIYRAIHHAWSADEGQTWQNLDGTALAPPWAADDTGPATRVTLDDEFESQTWLSNLLVKGGKAHFLYLKSDPPARQHYVRYDLAGGKREIDLQPAFRGESFEIRSLDGFFASGGNDAPDPPLYCVGRDAAGHVVCLASSDNGSTWRDHARSAAPFGVYAIGGCRRVTADGSVIGSFTDTGPPDAAGAGIAPKVFFFRIGSAPPGAPATGP